MRARAAIPIVHLGLLCALLAGCGSSSQGTRLAIVVENGAGQHAYELSCDPANGDVPNPAALCKSLEQHATAMLMPPDTGQTCGGAFLTPYIHVTGSFKGETVKTTISSCYGNGAGEQLWLGQLPPPPE